MSAKIRHDWSLDEVLELYQQPLLDLVFQAQEIHRRHHDPHAIQCCSLLSIKTGACPEDCRYCSQSSRYHTDVEREGLLDVADIVAAARNAKDSGASRFCMGAAWRSVKGGEQFDRVLEIIRSVAAVDIEVCVTLGMLEPWQAEALKEAGLTVYNHNLDTSAEFYPQVVTTRTFDDRVETLRRVQAAGLSVCSGGILGMGEDRRDRCSMLRTLARFDPHPESVPVNMLVPIPGTPMEDQPPLDPFELVRTIAVARLLMPEARVRLSAGRGRLSREAQAFCFLAGANSIFLGDRLLTTPNTGPDADMQLLEDLGLCPV